MTRTHPLNTPSDPTQGEPRMSSKQPWPNVQPTGPAPIPTDVMVKTVRIWREEPEVGRDLALWRLMGEVADRLTEQAEQIESARGWADYLVGELEQRGRGRLVAWAVGIVALAGVFVAGWVVL